MPASAGQPLDEWLLEDVTRLQQAIALALVEPMRPLPGHPRSHDHLAGAVLARPCLGGRELDTDPTRPMALADDEPADRRDPARLERGVDRDVDPADDGAALLGDERSVVVRTLEEDGDALGRLGGGRRVPGWVVRSATGAASASVIGRTRTTIRRPRARP